MLSEGTKSVLFGAHSVVHSIVVIAAWKKLYGAWPSWRVCVCIFLHDIGYWGKDYLTNKSNDGHAELGTKVATALFGPDFGLLVLGHSAAACRKHGVKISRLEAPDDYSWVIAPLTWMRWNRFVEGFTITPEAWKNAVRTNFARKNKLSGTELLHTMEQK